MLQDLIANDLKGWDQLEWVVEGDDRVVDSTEFEHESGTIIRFEMYRSGVIQAAGCRPEDLPTLSKGAFMKGIKTLIPSRNWETLPGHSLNAISRPR